MSKPYHKPLPSVQHPEEKVLHPTHFHNGIEICHQHSRSKVTFTAWNDGEPVNKRVVEMENKTITEGFNTFQEFYNAMKEKDWLCEKVR